MIKSIYFQTCVVNNREGECTPYYLCANDSTIIVYGSVDRLIITVKDNAECPLLQPCCHLKSKAVIIPPFQKPRGCGFRYNLCYIIFSYFYFKIISGQRLCYRRESTEYRIRLLCKATCTVHRCTALLMESICSYILRGMLEIFTDVES